MSEDEKGDLDFLLAALEDDDGEDLTEVENKKHAKEDDKLMKRVELLTEIVTKNEKQKQADKLYETFMAEATPEAKELYTVLADDDMTPSQMKKVIDACNRKAEQVREKLGVLDVAVEDEKAKVRQEAEERWGSGPIQTGQSIPTDKEKDEYEALHKRNLAGDIRATADLLLNHVAVPEDRRNWDKERSR